MYESQSKWGRTPFWIYVNKAWLKCQMTCNVTDIIVFPTMENMGIDTRLTLLRDSDPQIWTKIYQIGRHFDLLQIRPMHIFASRILVCRFDGYFKEMHGEAKSLLSINSKLSQNLCIFLRWKCLALTFFRLFSEGASYLKGANATPSTYTNGLLVPFSIFFFIFFLSRFIRSFTNYGSGYVVRSLL